MALSTIFNAFTDNFDYIDGEGIAATWGTITGTLSDQTDLQSALNAKVSGTGASGQVAFWNGTGTQTGDNGLFWDNTNKRLGIGTVSPATALEVLGTTTISSGGLLSFKARSVQNVTNSIYTDVFDNLFISGGMGSGKTINFVRQGVGNVITITSANISAYLNVVCSSTSNYIGIVDNIHGAIRNRALWIDDSANITTSPLYGANSLGNYGYFGHTWRTTNAAVVTADRMFLDREGRWGLGVAPTTHKAIISAGTIASTANALNITGTVSTTAATQNGLEFTITGAGSGANSIRALALFLNAGYTGSNSTIGILSENSSQGTANTVFATSGNNSYNILGNMGMNANANATTTGHNIGQNMVAGGGSLNIGGEGSATSNKASATNIGLLGIGFNANATSPVYFGGAFYSYDPGSSVPTWGTSATLMADNGTSAVDILSLRDNGTAVFTVANGGAVTLTQTIQAQGYKSADGSNGATGSFTTVDLKTVTVKNGLITSIV